MSVFMGGIKGLQATKPRKGEKITPNSPTVVSYRGFLESLQQAVLGSVGGSNNVHSYVSVYKGVAGVLCVSKSGFHQLVTATTPQFLGVARSGLAGWTKYVGAVSHTGPSGLFSLSAVSVATD